MAEIEKTDGRLPKSMDLGLEDEIQNVKGRKMKKPKILRIPKLKIEKAELKYFD